LFHVTRKIVPSGRPIHFHPGGRGGYTRKGEPTPLTSKGPPETPLLDPIIYKSVIHRTQKRTPKTLIPFNKENPSQVAPNYLRTGEGSRRENTNRHPLHCDIPRNTPMIRVSIEASSTRQQQHQPTRFFHVITDNLAQEP